MNLESLGGRLGLEKNKEICRRNGATRNAWRIYRTNIRGEKTWKLEKKLEFHIKYHETYETHWFLLGKGCDHDRIPDGLF